MNKDIYKSKTVWGIGVFGIIVLLQYFGVGVDSTIVEVIKILSGVFTVYGLRDALI